MCVCVYARTTRQKSENYVNSRGPRLLGQLIYNWILHYGRLRGNRYMVYTRGEDSTRYKPRTSVHTFRVRADPPIAAYNNIYTAGSGAQQREHGGHSSLGRIQRCASPLPRCTLVNLLCTIRRNPPSSTPPPIDDSPPFSVYIIYKFIYIHHRYVHVSIISSSPE